MRNSSWTLRAGFSRIFCPAMIALNPPRAFHYDDIAVPNARLSTFRPAPGVTASTVVYFDGRGKEFQQRVEVSAGRVTVSGIAPQEPVGRRGAGVRTH